MANKTPEEYKLVTFGTMGLTGSATEISTADKDAKEIVRAMRSGAQHAVHFEKTLKKIDATAEQWEQTVLLKSSDFSSAMTAGEEASGRIYGRAQIQAPVNQQTRRAGHFANAQVEDMVMLDYRRKRAGALSKSLAQQEASAFHGTFEKTNTDFVKLGYPVRKAEYDAMLTKYGGDESKTRAYFGRQMDKQMKESAYYSQDLTRRQKEKEDEKQKAQEKREEEKEEKENKKKTFRTIGIIVAVVTAIADICRRILTATLDKAKETNRDFETAHRYNITYDDVKRFKYGELATGLPADIIMKAIGGLQSSFGDITKLDEKALAVLARVMGGKIRNLVESGLGGDNPKELMKLILDSFYKSGQAGINSIGQQVGKSQAERELITALEHAGMGDLAKVLSNMFYTNDFGIHAGTIKTADDYFSLYTPATDGRTPLGEVRIAELGQAINLASAEIRNWKDNVLKDFTESISGLVRWVDDLDLGKSAKDRSDESTENRKKAVLKVQELESKKETMTELVDTSLKEIAGISYKDYKSLSSVKRGEVVQNMYLKGGLEGAGTVELMGLINYINKQALPALKKELSKTTGKIEFHGEDYTLAGMIQGMKDLPSTSETTQIYNPSLSDYMMEYNRYVSEFGDITLERLFSGKYKRNKNTIDALATLAVKRGLVSPKEMHKYRNSFFDYDKDDKMYSVLKKLFKQGDLTQDDIVDVLTKEKFQGASMLENLIGEDEARKQRTATAQDVESMKEAYAYAVNYFSGLLKSGAYADITGVKDVTGSYVGGELVITIKDDKGKVIRQEKTTPEIGLTKDGSDALIFKKNFDFSNSIDSTKPTDTGGR